MCVTLPRAEKLRQPKGEQAAEGETCEGKASATERGAGKSSRAGAGGMSVRLSCVILNYNDAETTEKLVKADRGLQGAASDHCGG